MQALAPQVPIVDRNPRAARARPRRLQAAGGVGRRRREAGHVGFEEGGGATAGVFRGFGPARRAGHELVLHGDVVALDEILLAHAGALDPHGFEQFAFFFGDGHDAAHAGIVALADVDLDGFDSGWGGGGGAVVGNGGADGDGARTAVCLPVDGLDALPGGTAGWGWGWGW